jgi:probable rRNA maturation factor
LPVRLVVEAGPHAGVSRVAIARAARAMLGAIQMSNYEISILLTGDKQIENLNRIYRKKNRPTDVLAFSQREGDLGEQAGLLLGDVVVSVPTARRQAEARSRDVHSEVLLLVAHGLLHLVGWDHDTPARDRRMRVETARLVAVAERAARTTARARK